MSHPKLTYFPAAGRGEPIRNAFRISGRQFDDNRVEGKDWPALKPSTPWGTMPVLEVDGHSIGQSNSVLRFVGRRTGLYPTNYPAEEFTMAQIDDLLDVTEDVTNQVGQTISLSEDQKLIKRKELLNGVVGQYLTRLDKRLGANGGKYFVGAALTIADLKAVNWFSSGILDGFPPTVLDTHPHLAAYKKNTNEFLATFQPKK